MRGREKKQKKKRLSGQVKLNCGERGEKRGQWEGTFAF